jgi:hypothetical protein
LIIGCPVHGDFLQTPNNHTSLKQGCPDCGNLRGGGIGGYTQTLFENFPEKREIPATLYVIHMQCATDDFIKVGITTQTIKKRYQRAKVGDKHIKKTIIAEEQMSLYDAFTLEQHILSEMKTYQYFPNYIIDGQTECLKRSPDVINMILNLINPATN